MPWKKSSPLSHKTQEWLANYLILVVSVLAPAVGGLLVYRWYIGVMPANLAALAGLLLPFAALAWIRKRLELRTKARILVGVFSISAATTFEASGILGIGPLLSLLASFSVLAFYGNRAFLIALCVLTLALWTSAFALLQDPTGLAVDLSTPINLFGRALTMTLILGTLLFAMRGVVFLVSEQTQLAQRTSDDFRTTVSELNLFIDSANAPIFGIDNYGRVNEWNTMAATITGYSKQEVLGKDLINTYIADEYKPSVTNVFERALAGRNTATFEFPLFKKDGQRIEILLNATTRRDTQGAVIGVVGVGQDITSLRQQETLLSQTQKMEALGLLTGGIAHDFNNLLTVITGNLDFALDILDDPDETAPLKDLLKDASEASTDAAYLTGQLLSFASQQAFKLEKVNLHSLISGVLHKASPHLPDGIECSADIEQVDLVVMVDRVQLASALVNLINNARDAIEDSGTITVTARIEQLDAQAAASYPVPSGEYLLLAVGDDGCGIPENSLQRVTDPFFTTKSIGDGVGLGLSMVNGFANQLSGGLRIKSNVDAGTSVEIVIPLIRGEVERQPETRKKVTEALQGPGTVLIVEDEARLRSLSVRYLKESGFKVIEAEDGGQALEILAHDADEIDIVFSDIRMPGDMSGRRLVAAVSRLYPSIHLLLTSGYEDEAPDSSDEARSPEWNVPILRKPYSREGLIDALVDLRSATS